MPPDVTDAQGTVEDPKDTSSNQGAESQHDDPLKKESQKLSSWIGRLEAQQKKDREELKALREENERMRQDRSTNNQSASAPGDDLNTQITEMVLQGKGVDAIRQVMALEAQAKETISKRNQNQLDKIMGDMEGVPFFKDVKDKVRQIATDLVGKNYSPIDAVAFAFEKSRGDHFAGMLASGNVSGFDSASLETSGGGSRREDSGEKKGKLNADGKKAWEKERNSKIFKDESDWIAHMSPAVKARFIG